MTFRKRVTVVFFTVIVVPMLLFAITFIALGNYLVGGGRRGPQEQTVSVAGGSESICAKRLSNCGSTKPMMMISTTIISATSILG